MQKPLRFACLRTPFIGYLPTGRRQQRCDQKQTVEYITTPEWYERHCWGVEGAAQSMDGMMRALGAVE